MSAGTSSPSSDEAPGEDWWARRPRQQSAQQQTQHQQCHSNPAHQSRQAANRPKAVAPEVRSEVAAVLRVSSVVRSVARELSESIPSPRQNSLLSELRRCFELTGVVPKRRLMIVGSSASQVRSTTCPWTGGVQHWHAPEKSGRLMWAWPGLWKNCFGSPKRNPSLAKDAQPAANAVSAIKWRGGALLPLRKQDQPASTWSRSTMVWGGVEDDTLGLGDEIGCG